MKSARSIVAAVLLVGGCSSPPQQPPLPPMTAEAAVNEFLKDESAAQEKYGGRKLTVTGKIVNGHSLLKKSGPTFWFALAKAGSDSKAEKQVVCYFVGRPPADFVRFTDGRDDPGKATMVSITGTVRGMSPDRVFLGRPRAEVLLDDCTFAKR